jgi:hypothetical protein
MIHFLTEKEIASNETRNGTSNKEGALTAFTPPSALPHYAMRGSGFALF